MEVKAKRNIIYGGEIRKAGEIFECEESKISALQARDLIEAEMLGLPSLEEEIRRKNKRDATKKTDSIGVENDIQRTSADG